MSGCTRIIFISLLPRLTIFLLAIFTDLITTAYDSYFWPIFGFLFLPFTTLAYIVFYNYWGIGIAPFEWVVIFIIFLADLSTYGTTAGYTKSHFKN